MVDDEDPEMGLGVGTRPETVEVVVVEPAMRTERGKEPIQMRMEMGMEMSLGMDTVTEMPIVGR
jgi:hypothetical protein